MRSDAEQETWRTWATLGRDGVLSGLFDGPDPRYGYRTDRLRELFDGLSAGTRPPGIGGLLSICVQATNAIPLLRGARAGPAASVLDEVLAGTAQLAVAATDEAAAGSDLAGLGTTVEPDGAQLVISGGKRWIVNATTAAWALVLARHRAGRQFTSFTLVLVPLDAPGVTRQAADTGAFAGSAIGHLGFDAVTVPADHVIGGRGRGLALFARQLAGERLASALWAERLCARVLRDTLDRVRSRRLGDRTLWESDAVRHRFAAAAVRHRCLRALCDELCREPVAGQRTDLLAAEAATVKAAGSATIDDVLAVCAPLFGADGYGPDGPQQLRNEAGMFGIAGGSTPLLLDAISDQADLLCGAT